MEIISHNLQEYVNLKHRFKTDVAAVILEAVASSEVAKSKIYYRSFPTYHRLKG